MAPSFLTKLLPAIAAAFAGSATVWAATTYPATKQGGVDFLKAMKERDDVKSLPNGMVRVGYERT
jgi:hypothetical protein